MLRNVFARLIGAGFDQREKQVLIPPSAPAPIFERYGGVADRVVIIDIETTGVYNSDRVLEIATVTLDLDGQVVDEWDSLVNPGRDVGPTWLHGINSRMLYRAPSFNAIAAELAVRIHGAVLCAHNLPFDTRMLGNEYGRCGIELTWGTGLDTLTATGGKLGVVCAQYGIKHTGAHRALHDARATAALLNCLADRLPQSAACATVHSPISVGEPRRHPRDGFDEARQAPPSFLAQMSRQVTHASLKPDIAPYIDLLDRAMADIQLDLDEKAALLGIAHGLDFDDAQIQRSHEQWLRDLIETACADGVVDSNEYDQLLRAAHVLGIDDKFVHDQTVGHRTATTTITLHAGLAVCFTGEASDRQGQQILREDLETHARLIGLVVEETFTKSRCDLLVAADPATQSSKGSKARGWNIPIIAAGDFLASVADDEITSHVMAVGGRQAATCSQCGQAFTRVAKGRRQRLCADCIPLTRPDGTQRHGLV